MKDNTNLKVLETLYVGIDVSKNSNQTCILTFNGDKLCNFSSAKSPEQLSNCKLEKLIDIIVKTSKNKFKDPKKIADVLKKAANSSYRLDKTSYDSLNIAIASSLNLIQCYEQQIKYIDEAIDKLVKGLDNQNQYKSLMSIPGIGSVFAAGSVITNESNYHAYYQKKFNEVTIHQHARALVLTARKLVRLIYGLMSKDQLYNCNK